MNMCFSYKCIWDSWQPLTTSLKLISLSRRRKWKLTFLSEPIISTWHPIVLWKILISKGQLTLNTCDMLSTILIFYGPHCISRLCTFYFLGLKSTFLKHSKQIISHKITSSIPRWRVSKTHIANQTQPNNELKHNEVDLIKHQQMIWIPATQA